MNTPSFAALRDAKNLRALVRAVLAAAGACAFSASLIGGCAGEDDAPDGDVVRGANGQSCVVKPPSQPYSASGCSNVDRVIEGDPVACGLGSGVDVPPEKCKSLCDLDAFYGVRCTVSEPKPGQNVLSCQANCIVDGRHPAELEPFAPALDGSLASHFVRMAFFEHASIHAFEELAFELRAHGAPAPLVRAARRAAADEKRHAKMARALARRFGASRDAIAASFPEPRAPHGVRPLLEIAMDNAREGTARETLGTFLGSFQAKHARDAVVRGAMHAITRDELRHAALSHRVHAWAMSVLDEAGARAIDAERVRALHELDFERAPVASEAAVTLGWPAPQQAHRMLIAARAALAA